MIGVEKLAPASFASREVWRDRQTPFGQLGTHRARCYDAQITEATGHGKIMSQSLDLDGWVRLSMNGCNELRKALTGTIQFSNHPLTIIKNHPIKGIASRESKKKRTKSNALNNAEDLESQTCGLF
jgi:hypothetical protein